MSDRSCRSLKKSDESDFLTVALLTKSDMSNFFFFWEQIALSVFCNQKTKEEKNCCFHHVFDSFSLLFPFLCPRVNCSHWSLLHCSFLKSNRSDLLLKKRKLLFYSFGYKKRVICMKNQRANSQPCFYSWLTVLCSDTWRLSMAGSMLGKVMKEKRFPV